MCCCSLEFLCTYLALHKPSLLLPCNSFPQPHACVAAGTHTQQSADEPLTASQQRSQSATAPQEPATAPGESQPSNPPAETNGSEAEQSHAVATVTDAAAVSSVVGANQPLADEAAKPEAADVSPAEQAMTTKAEPGDPVNVPGTVDTVAAAAAAQVAVVDVPTHLTDEERRLLDWHWANLEYGCSARLSQVGPFDLCLEQCYELLSL